MDGNRSRIAGKERYLACQPSTSFFSRFVVSRRSIPSLVIILEFYSDVACPDIELDRYYGISAKNFWAAANNFLADIQILAKLGFQLSWTVSDIVMTVAIMKTHQEESCLLARDVRCCLDLKK